MLVYVTIRVRLWWHLRLLGLVVVYEDTAMERSLILFPAPLCRLGRSGILGLAGKSGLP